MSIVLGWLLLAAIGILAALANRGDATPTAETVGYAFGAALGPLGLIFAIRWAYLKVTRSERPAWTPTLLYVAAGIAFLAMLSNLSQQQ